METFSYKEYSNIIETLKENNLICDFKDINKLTKKFVVIRHDVEFSVERAYEMALLETNLGITSSYLFQIRNNAYNLFSKENIEMVQEINKLGHKIGLHVHLGMLDDLQSLKDYIQHDIHIMESFLAIPVDRFSYHRPPKNLLRLNLRIEGLINTYDRMYFDFKENNEDLDRVKVKYFADSMHQWKYGYPAKEEVKYFDKIQLLIHPYSWTEKGYENIDNFYSLKEEKLRVFNKTIISECNHFNEYFRE